MKGSKERSIVQDVGEGINSNGKKVQDIEDPSTDLVVFMDIPIENKILRGRKTKVPAEMRTIITEEVGDVNKELKGEEIDKSKDNNIKERKKEFQQKLEKEWKSLRGEQNMEKNCLGN
ncbi:hypothetical protein ACH5RR_015783 [Cinchona calisaya]|uniref:Uncharacterized protein n=1 Tax=Cinchona calisaya TaxID=153742 RepID=A0ABD2ZV06_9GENT